MGREMKRYRERIEVVNLGENHEEIERVNIGKRGRREREGLGVSQREK